MPSHFPQNEILCIGSSIIDYVNLFISGLLCSITRGWPLEKGIDFASHIGGAIVATHGAELSKQNWKKIRQQYGIEDRML